MFAWVVMIAWGISMVIGEIRFNRAMKRRSERTFDDLRSSWLREIRDQDTPTAGPERHDTLIMFHPNEDDFDTEETGAVFDIRERYPDEFAQDRSDRPEVHY